MQTIMCRGQVRSSGFSGIYITLVEVGEDSYQVLHYMVHIYFLRCFEWLRFYLSK